MAVYCTVCKKTTEVSYDNRYLRCGHQVTSLMGVVPSEPPTKAVARRTDPPTSHQAAAAITPHLGRIQQLVYDVYTDHGAMSARYAEKLPEFDDYGFSTIRKRISELAQMGLLQQVGFEPGRTPAIIYEISQEKKDDL